VGELTDGAVRDRIYNAFLNNHRVAESGSDHNNSSIQSRSPLTPPSL
jgi:hypothetical protein